MPRWTEVLIAVAFVAMQIIGAIAAKKSKDAKAAELARQTGGTAGAPLAGGGRVQSPAVAQPPWKSARTMAHAGQGTMAQPTQMRVVPQQRANQPVTTTPFMQKPLAAKPVPQLQVAGKSKPKRPPMVQAKSQSANQPVRKVAPSVTAFVRPLLTAVVAKAALTNLGGSKFGSQLSLRRGIMWQVVLSQPKALEA